MRNETVLEEQSKKKQTTKANLKMWKGACVLALSQLPVSKKKIWNFVYIFYYYFFASIISIWIPWWCIYCFMVKLEMSYVLFNLFNLVVWFLRFPSYCEKDYLTVQNNSEVVWRPCLSCAKKQMRERDREGNNINQDGLRTLGYQKWKLLLYADEN